MNRGLEGRKAIVCASSRGLGRACAMALAREGVAVVLNGRDVEQVEATAAAIRSETGAEVTAVAADLCSDEGRERLVGACPEPDILVTNNGGPAPGRFEDWDRAAWLAGLEQNLLAPVFLIRAVIGGMRARGFRTDRQHHLGDGAITASADGAIHSGTQRAHRSLPGPFARGCL